MDLARASPSATAASHALSSGLVPTRPDSNSSIWHRRASFAVGVAADILAGESSRPCDTSSKASSKMLSRRSRSGVGKATVFAQVLIACSAERELLVRTSRASFDALPSPEITDCLFLQNSRTTWWGMNRRSPAVDKTLKMSSTVLSVYL